MGVTGVPLVYECCKMVGGTSCGLGVPFRYGVVRVGGGLGVGGGGGSL